MKRSKMMLSAVLVVGAAATGCTRPNELGLAPLDQPAVVKTSGAISTSEVTMYRMGTLDPLSRETRTMQRYFFTGAPPVELDKAGRMVVPSKLLEELEIGREVTIAGVYDHLEIWDRASWREQLTQAGGSAEDVAERLANRD